MPPKTAIKQWDTCVQWRTRTQINEEATEGTASRHQQWGVNDKQVHPVSKQQQAGKKGCGGRDVALGFPKFNAHTPGLAQDGWYMNTFLIYTNSVCSLSGVSRKKITNTSNPGFQRYKLYLKTKFNLKRWTEVVVGKKREGTDKRITNAKTYLTVQLSLCISLHVNDISTYKTVN